jgi:hypothetical protein
MATKARAKQAAYNEWLKVRVEQGYSPSVFEYTLFSDAFDAGWEARQAFLDEQRAAYFEGRAEGAKS